MNRLWGALPVALMFRLVWGAAAAAPPGAAPGTQQVPGGGGHGHHASRGAAAALLGVPEGASAVLWKPDLERQPLEVKGGGVGFPRTGMGDYHAIVAEWEGESAREARIRYLYMRGRPSGHSPGELLAEAKTELEIVPDPLPREHYRYNSADRWGFRVRFREAPLAGVPVWLETAHGSGLEARTDAEGRVAFELPDDFPSVTPGRRATPPAGYSLSVEHAGGRGRFHTVLLADYHAGPHHWQSTGWGLGVLALGLVAGLAVSRIGSEQTHRGRKDAWRS